MNTSVHSIVEQLKSLTMMEAAELVTQIETTFGVSRNIGPTSVERSPIIESEAEEQTEYDVLIYGYPVDKKIEVIKIVRQITGLGLKESKDLVETFPAKIAENVDKEKAKELKAKFANTGAQIEFK